MTDTIDIDRIRTLNDRFRASLTGGTVVLTRGVRALGSAGVAQALSAVAAFTAFDPDNDPHGEHDFGAVTVAGERLFFKIDCYDRSLRLHSPDPADDAVTCRVMTVMRADEY